MRIERTVILLNSSCSSDFRTTFCLRIPAIEYKSGFSGYWHRSKCCSVTHIRRYSRARASVRVRVPINCIYYAVIVICQFACTGSANRQLLRIRSQESIITLASRCYRSVRCSCLCFCLYQGVVIIIDILLVVLHIILGIRCRIP